MTEKKNKKTLKLISTCGERQSAYKPAQNRRRSGRRLSSTHNSSSIIAMFHLTRDVKQAMRRTGPIDPGATHTRCRCRALFVRANKHKCVSMCGGAVTLAPHAIHHLSTITRQSTLQQQITVDSDVTSVSDVVRCMLTTTL